MTEKISSLQAISPVDGRYRKSVKELEEFFSEFALIKNRVMIEIEYLIALSESKLTKNVIRELKKEEKRFLRDIYSKFSLVDAEKVKEIEKITAHDVKAVEYFIREKIEKSSLNLKDLTEIIHFGLTSEDINNLAISLTLDKTIKKVYLPILVELIKKLIKLAKEYKNLAMLARTHGQPASPTTVGKEFINFGTRICECVENLKNIKFPGKLTGASGNYNALYTAYPNVDWINFSKEFITKLGLEPEVITTQILFHDSISDMLHIITSINNIILNLDQDMWYYISEDYFRQKIAKQEVGSSTMPHKLNPIDFENSEGNLQLATALFEFLANKLQISRLQRDLSDSTVKRNYGVAFAYSIIAYKNTIKGLNKIYPNSDVIKKELNARPEILTEAIQTVLRREKYPVAYEKLKKLARGKALNIHDIQNFIKNLDVQEKVKKELLQLKPEKYIGLATQLTSIGIKECEKIVSEL